MIGMFFEIPTIWKKKRCSPRSDGVFEAPKTTPMMNRILSGSTTKFLKTNSLGVWRPRRIGVFFTQHSEDDVAKETRENGQRQNTPTTERSWTCLVLIESTKIEDNEHLLFCYRKVHNEDSMNKPRPNANTTSGRRRYTIEEDNLQEFIGYITKDLLPKYLINDGTPKQKRCADIVTHLGKDIFWGWEEFATQVVRFASVWNQKEFV